MAWDREAAPLALHTHIAWNITQGEDLEARLAPFYKAGYPGYYSVEHHSGENEYQNVGIQLERVREALEKLDDLGGHAGTIIENNPGSIAQPRAVRSPQ